MMDLPISPFLAPAQLATLAPPYDAAAAASAYEFPGCALTPTPSTSNDSGTESVNVDDFRHVFCSPPRQSFQLLLRGGENPMLKDELELPPPRRSARMATPPVSQLSAAKTKKRAKPTTPVASVAAAAASITSKPAKTAGAALETQQQQKKRPKRKASYLARKEEKEALVKHLDELQTQLNTLKYQAVVHGSFRAQTQARKRLTNNILTDAIQKHQLAVAGLQAMLSKYSSLQEHSPIETTIRLGLDPPTRRETLQQLKAPKLLEAKHFITERSRGMDLTKTYAEEERFETPSGDLCALRFDIIPIRGAASVRAVFDAMLFYVSNIEITISETLGHITIREDDDSSDEHIKHMRLATNIADWNLQTESNSVLFSEFLDADPEFGGASCGVLASDFVDEDALYPYRPAERVRRDVSAMVTVTPLMMKRESVSVGNSSPNNQEQTAGGAGGADDEELVVVLKRWSLAKMHRPNVSMPTHILEEIRDAYGRWGDELSKTMRAHVLVGSGSGTDEAMHEAPSS